MLPTTQPAIHGAIHCMNQLPATRQRSFLAAVFAGLAIWVAPSVAQSVAADAGTNEIRIVALQGMVEISPAGATTWVLTQTNQVLHPSDKLRTGPNSRVTLRWSDQSMVPFGALTEIEVLPPHTPGAQSGLHLFRGILSFFHRDEPGRIRVITRGATAGVEGTEFVLAVDATNGTQRTTLSLIDGRVQFTNEQGAIVLTSGQQAVAELGKAPARTAGFITNNVLQWCFYYPAVLDLHELPLTAQEEQILSESIAAYRSGDLLRALARYPDGRQPGSDAERVYYAALLHSMGRHYLRDGEEAPQWAPSQIWGDFGWQANCHTPHPGRLPVHAARIDRRIADEGQRICRDCKWFRRRLMQLQVATAHGRDLISVPTIWQGTGFLLTAIAVAWHNRDRSSSAFRGRYSTPSAANPQVAGNQGGRAAPGQANKNLL